MSAQVSGRLSLGQKLGWAAGTHGTSAMIGVLVTFVLSYLTTVLGIEPGIAGALIFASRAYDIIADPVMGHISDRTKSSLGIRTHGHSSGLSSRSGKWRMSSRT